MWPIEEIPSNDKLYYRIHDAFFSPLGILVPGVFKEKGEGEEKGMSTDWEKYSTPQRSLNLSRDPAKNSIGSFVVNTLLDLKLKVVHAPIYSNDLKNQAHANVKGIEGENQTEIRLKLLGLMTWEIRSEKTRNYPT